MDLVWSMTKTYLDAFATHVPAVCIGAARCLLIRMQKKWKHNIVMSYSSQHWIEGCWRSHQCDLFVKLWTHINGLRAASCESCLKKLVFRNYTHSCGWCTDDWYCLRNRSSFGFSSKSIKFTSSVMKPWKHCLKVFFSSTAKPSGFIDKTFALPHAPPKWCVTCWNIQILKVAPVMLHCMEMREHCY